MRPKYRVNISWSDDDNCYLVELPDFSHSLQKYVTHGETYSDAATNAQELLELIIQEYESEGKSLPTPPCLQMV